MVNFGDLSFVSVFSFDAILFFGGAISADAAPLAEASSPRAAAPPSFRASRLVVMRDYLPAAFCAVL